MPRSWTPFNLAMIPGVPEALDAVGQAANALTTALGMLAGLLDVLAGLLQFITDAIAASIQALIEVIEAVANAIYDLLNTGIYFYLDKGPLFSGAAPDGLPGLLGRWAASFDDLGDAARPQFSPDASISCLVFAVGANNLPDFGRLLDLLAALFGIPALKYEDVNYDINLPERIEAGMSTPPDWESVRLGEVIPPFKQLGDILMRAIGMIKISDTYGPMLGALAEIIRQKAAALEAIAAEIQAIVDAITALIESAGLYILHVEAEGTANLISAAHNASDTPPWNLDAYTACVCLLGGTADFGPVVELLG
jgi:hypothetical protein